MLNYSRDRESLCGTYTNGLKGLSTRLKNA